MRSLSCGLRLASSNTRELILVESEQTGLPTSLGKVPHSTYGEVMKSLGVEVITHHYELRRGTIAHSFLFRDGAVVV